MLAYYICMDPGSMDVGRILTCQRTVYIIIRYHSEHTALQGYTYARSISNSNEPQTRSAVLGEWCMITSGSARVGNVIFWCCSCRRRRCCFYVVRWFTTSTIPTRFCVKRAGTERHNYCHWHSTLKDIDMDGDGWLKSSSSSPNCSGKVAPLSLAGRRHRNDHHGGRVFGVFGFIIIIIIIINRAWVRWAGSHLCWMTLISPPVCHFQGLYTAYLLIGNSMHQWRFLLLFRHRSSA